MVQPGAAADPARDGPRLDRVDRGAEAISVRDRGSLPAAGARARRSRRTADVALEPPRVGAERGLLVALNRRREVPDDHAVDRRRGHRARTGSTARSSPPAASRRIARRHSARFTAPTSTDREHLRDALQRRLPARLVPGARARLQEHARGGAARRQHPDLGRREPDRDDARPASSRCAAITGCAARRSGVPTYQVYDFAIPLVTHDKKYAYDEVLDWITEVGRAARPGIPGADARGLRRPLDRRLRERRQAQRRLLGAGVRHASLHAAELHRYAGRCVHAGARDGALDAHHPVARDAAVHLLGLHDLRRRSAVDAERGAAARPHAPALDRPDRADRPAPARHRQHHQHLLHAGHVRRLRAARAPAGGGRQADHLGDPDRDLHDAPQGLLRRCGRSERPDRRDLGADPALLQLALLRLPVRDLLRVGREAGEARSCRARTAERPGRAKAT